MIDHLTLRVRDLEAAKAFYLKALAPLGYELVMEFEGGAGFGVKGKPDFWLTQDAKSLPQHVAFAAGDRPQVDAFFAGAMSAGGRDNGGPGVRREYHPHYYGAFVFDPSGHNIEAVCHLPAKAGARKKARPAPRKATAKPRAKTRRS